MTINQYQNKELGLGGIPELEAVYSAMETCYKKITGNDDVKIQYKMGTRELEVAYREDSGEWMRIPINQLSDGYKSTISLVADIAYRMAVLNPQFLGDVCKKTKGIVLIDEVELHMHPSWQRKILDVLKNTFPNLQFIVTTHSPIILSEADEDYNLIFLKREENKIEITPMAQLNGYDANMVLEKFMGTKSINPVTERFIDSIYNAIECGDYLAAKSKIDRLAALTNENHQDVIMARMELQRRMK